MIRVKIEVVRFGDEDQVTTPHVLYIANDATSLSPMSRYGVWVDIDPREKGAPNAEARFFHLRQRGILACVRDAFAAVVE